MPTGAATVALLRSVAVANAVAEAERRTRAVRCCRARRRRADVVRGLGELFDGAVRVIADAAQWGGDATDAARKLALEAIANAYAADDGDAHDAWLRKRVLRLLPPHALLAPANNGSASGPLLAALAPALQAATPRPSAASSSADADAPAAADGAEELALRYLQCAGAALVAADSEDDVSDAEVRAVATAMLRALLPFARTLGAFFYHDTREELLRLMSAAISATADDEGAPPPALTLSLPADLQTQLCAAAGGWRRAAGGAARAAAVALVGGVLRECGVGLVAAEAVQGELLHWLRQRKEPLAAAEAAAALHDAGRAADAVAAVLPGLRSRIEMVDWLGAEEKAHALELLGGVSQ